MHGKAASKTHHCSGWQHPLYFTDASGRPPIPAMGCVKANSGRCKNHQIWCVRHGLDKTALWQKAQFHLLNDKEGCVKCIAEAKAEKRRILAQEQQDQANRAQVEADALQVETNKKNWKPRTKNWPRDKPGKSDDQNV